MANREICPLCGADVCTLSVDNEWNHEIGCKTYHADIRIRCNVFEDYQNSITFSRLMNLIVEKIIRQKVARSGAKWVFYYDEKETERPTEEHFYNLAPLLSSYPETFADCIDRSLLNLSVLRPSYGEILSSLGVIGRLFFPDSINGSREYLRQHCDNTFNILFDLEYVKSSNKGPMISSEGWMHIEDLRKKNAEVKQGFIAMSFKPEAENIRKSFKRAITAAGYVPMVIDEKEHNHQIVPELLKEIEKSRFLVLDVTYPNYGAYYEAGYALALGKEVIICCDNKVFSNDKYERPHFDIAQTSQIRWSTEEELVERLIKRIKATVIE